jgi:hypothetical protein
MNYLQQIIDDTIRIRGGVRDVDLRKGLFWGIWHDLTAIHGMQQSKTGAGIGHIRVAKFLRTYAEVDDKEAQSPNF